MKATARAAARAVGCLPEEVFLASTGVIGEPMDAGPIEKALPGLVAAAKADAWDEAARAIMTTDTYPKLATRSARLGEAQVTINGIAKGSGMIAPDMATMLVFIFTDAALPARILQKLLERVGGAKLQLHHRGRRYLDLGHGAPRRDGQGGGEALRPQIRRRSSSERYLPGRSMSCAAISPIRW